MQYQLLWYFNPSWVGNSDASSPTSQHLYIPISTTYGLLQNVVSGKCLGYVANLSNYNLVYGTCDSSNAYMSFSIKDFGGTNYILQVMFTPTYCAYTTCSYPYQSCAITLASCDTRSTIFQLIQLMNTISTLSLLVTTMSMVLVSIQVQV